MSENKALSGVRVLDLTQMAAGPICTEKLGMLGADVIKVEQPIIGERGRNDNLKKYPDGKIPQSYKWALLHSNKKSVTLDLKLEEGKKLLEEFIKKCDVMIENFGPGTIECLGFPWERIHEINPRIIFCQIKGYGKFSPFAKFGGMDALIQASGGLAAQTGLKDSPPVISNVALADIPSGDYALAGILAALYQREHSGRGQRVEINMQEVVMSISRLSLSNTSQRRGVPMQFIGANGPKNLFRCKPRYENDENNYCFIAIRDTPGQKMWKTFCGIMERPDLAEDERYATGPQRSGNQELEEEVTKWTIQHDKLDVMKVLCEHGINAGATLSIEELAQMPDMKESGFLRDYDHPKLGKIVLPTMAIRLSDSKIDIEPSPDLGEQTEEIYKEVLGLTDEQIADLKARKVI